MINIIENSEFTKCGYILKYPKLKYFLWAGFILCERWHGGNLNPKLLACEVGRIFSK